MKQAVWAQKITQKIFTGTYGSAVLGGRKNANLLLMGTGLITFLDRKAPCLADWQLKNAMPRKSRGRTNREEEGQSGREEATQISEMRLKM